MPLPEATPVVVILHYGRPEATRRLHRQLAQSDPQWRDRIFVLDNHAPQAYPQAWQRLDANLFWAGALDHTLRICSESGWSHLWFMNNDAFFVSSPPFLERAWQRLRIIEQRKGPVGIYTPSFDNHPYHPQMVCDPQKAYRRTALVDGVAPLINVACWKALGGLDHADNVQGYGVDLLFSLRASRAGWPVIVDHQVCMRHVHHSTARTIRGFLERAAAREKMYLEKRLGPDYAELLRQAKIDFTDEDRL